MSDEQPDSRPVAVADPEALEARVRLLEAFLARGLAVAAPRANPPITIGPFTNVPAPGSSIRSDWPQQITTMVVAHNTRWTALEIQAGLATATTAANGNGSWSFNEFFPSPPRVVANVQSGAGTGLIVVIFSVSTGGFQANITTHAGAAFVGSVQLSWIAMSTPVALARTDDEADEADE